MSAATKTRRQQTEITCFFKVIEQAFPGEWQVIADNIAYDEAEQLAAARNAIVRFSSYSVQRIGTKQTNEKEELTAANSRVVPVFNVQAFDEYCMDVIGSSLEYNEAVKLAESRKMAGLEVSGYRRVPIPHDQVEYQKPREKAAVYNRAEAITFRLFLMPLVTVILLAVLVVLKKLGVL